jgi:hypothetical protein
MIITKLDYEILKRIPVYPEEKSRGQIVKEIKESYPRKYKNLTTSVFDAVLLKYTTLFPITEEKDEVLSLFFQDQDLKEADCLHSVLEPIDLEWVKRNIGMQLDVDEDEVYNQLVGLFHRKPRVGWYKQSDFRLPLDS